MRQTYKAEMNRLGEFWSQHFVLEDRETPVDNVNGQEAVISWQENYYLSGLPSNVLNMNPWLEQSKDGWIIMNQKAHWMLGNNLIR